MRFGGVDRQAAEGRVEGLGGAECERDAGAGEGVNLGVEGGDGFGREGSISGVVVAEGEGLDEGPWGDGDAVPGGVFVTGADAVAKALARASRVVRSFFPGQNL